MIDKAKKDYLNGMKYKDLAEKYDVSINTVKSWVNRNGWAKLKKGCTQNKKDAHKDKVQEKGLKDDAINEKDYITSNEIGEKEASNKTNAKQLHQARYGNKNAEGHGAPEGNLNSIKHGAHQSIYAEMLNEEDKNLYEQIDPTIAVDDEIRLLRLKIARLLNLKESFFYSPFGDKLTKELTEEERIAGINACMGQLRKLIETKHKLEIDLGINKDIKNAQLDQIKAKTEKIKGVSSDVEDMSELRRLLLDE